MSKLEFNHGDCIRRNVLRRNIVVVVAFILASSITALWPTRTAQSWLNDVVVFSDALLPGWQDWSWNTTANLNNPSPAIGSASIAVTYNQPWAGLSLWSPSPIPTSAYDTITFMAHGGNNGARELQLFIEEGDAGPVSSAATFDVPAGQWTAFTITVAALGNPAQIKRINIQDRSGTIQPTFYVDEIRLRANAAPLVSADIYINAVVTPTPISPYLLASNLPAWLQRYRFDNPSFQARTRASGIKLLRLPGGSWSNSYGWLSCELRQNDPSRQPCGPGWESWAARPRDFIAFLKATGMAGMWVVSPLGTSKEAAAAVAYFNGHITDTTSIGTDIRGTNWYTIGHWAALRASAGYTDPVGIRYWEFGNEVYASKPSTGGALCQSWGWEDTWTCDGYEYVNGVGSGSSRREGYLEFRQAMKAVDPTIELGAVGYEWPGTPGDGVSSWQTFAGWGSRVISAAGAALDFYTIHPYPFFQQPLLISALSKPQNHLGPIVAALNQAFDTYANGQRAPIAVTEYNLISVSNNDAGQLMTRMINALHLADTLGQAATLQIPIFAQWNLANGPDAITGTEYGLMHEANGFFRAAQYYVYPLWARFGSHMISATTTLSPEVVLSVYAGVVDSNTLSLLAINKTNQPITATINTGSWGPLVSGRHWRVQANSLDSQTVSYNGVTNPSDNLIEPPDVFAASGNVITRTLPPYSINLFHLGKQTANIQARAYAPIAHKP